MMNAVADQVAIAVAQYKAKGILRMIIEEPELRVHERTAELYSG
jgi:hypothetical protein